MPEVWIELLIRKKFLKRFHLIMSDLKNVPQNNDDHL